MSPAFIVYLVSYVFYLSFLQMLPEYSLFPV